MTTQTNPTDTDKLIYINSFPNELLASIMSFDKYALLGRSLLLVCAQWNHALTTHEKSLVSDIKLFYKGVQVLTWEEVRQITNSWVCTIDEIPDQSSIIQIDEQIKMAYHLYLSESGRDWCNRLIGQMPSLRSMYWHTSNFGTVCNEHNLPIPDWYEEKYEYTDSVFNSKKCSTSLLLISPLDAN